MTTSSSTKSLAKASMNGQEASSASSGYVNVESKETLGIIILGVLFFFVLLAMLRSQRRERKLLEKIAKLQASLLEKTPS